MLLKFQPTEKSSDARTAFSRIHLDLADCSNRCIPYNSEALSKIPVEDRAKLKKFGFCVPHDEQSGNCFLEGRQEMLGLAPQMCLVDTVSPTTFRVDHDEYFPKDENAFTVGGE